MTLSQHSNNSLQHSPSRRLADIILAVQLTPQRAQDFYGEHKGKSFFDTLVNFMTSGPVYALVLARQNAIKEWRSLMGPTNSNTARAEIPKRYSILHLIFAQHWLTNFLLLPLLELLLCCARLALDCPSCGIGQPAVCGHCMEQMVLRMQHMVQTLLQVQHVRSASSSHN